MDAREVQRIAKKAIEEYFSTPENAGAVAGVDATAALTRAFTNRYGVYVTTPTVVNSLPTYGVNVVEVWPDGTMTGAGAAAMGYTGVCPFETLQLGTTSTDFATKYMRRQVNHTGGTPGYVSSCLRVETYVADGATNYEWNAVFKLDTAASGGENNSAYFQTLVRPGAGPVWVNTHELIETTAVNNPTVGRVTQEIDHRSNGTDDNNARVVQDIVVTRYDPTGPATEVAHGHRIQTGGDASASVKNGYDTTLANITFASLRMAETQGIAWGTGRLFMVSGAPDNGMGSDDDYCLRKGGTAGSRMYVKAAGTWTGIL